MPNPLGSVVATDNLLRLQLIGTLVSAIAYGFIVCLFLHCLSLLISNRRSSYTCKTRAFLIAYVVAMFSLSTASAVQTFVFITRAIVDGNSAHESNLISMNLPIFLPPAVIGADGLLLWRCYILYYQTFPLKKLIYCGLGLTSIGSLFFGVIYYLPPHTAEFAFTFHSPLTPSVVTVSMTTSTNFVRAILIIARLMYHQETMRRLMGKQYGSPYSRVIFMIVESCGLIVVTGVAYLILVKGGDVITLNGGIIPLLLLPHVCIASPLFIIYQAARGRTFTSLRASEINTPNIHGLSDEDCISPIQFQRRNTTSSNFDGIPDSSFRGYTTFTK